MILAGIAADEEAQRQREAAAAAVADAVDEARTNGPAPSADGEAAAGA
jgi:hypothetical protein